MAEYASAERDRLEAERQALELAAHEAEDRRRQAELDVQRAGFETATAEAKLLADQLLTEEKDRRLELERLASLEATARLEAETATARLKEQEAKQPVCKNDFKRCASSRTHLLRSAHLCFF